MTSPATSKPLPAPSKPPTHLLPRAQAALQETNERIKALEARRRAVILAGKSDADVAAVDAEIEAAQRVQRTRADRVQLLLEAAEEEAVQRRVKEQAALIGRIEGKLAERDKVGAELERHLEAADRCFLKVLALGRDVAAAWPWQASDLAPIGAASDVILLMVRHHIYRTGGRPSPLGGQASPHAGPPFPGGVCEDLRWAQLPEKIRPMTEKLAAASAHASRLMRGIRSSGSVEPAATPVTNGHAPSPPPVRTAEAAVSVPAPTPVVSDDGSALMPRERTENERKLSALLQEQARLAMLDGPEAEQAYLEIGKQIATIS